MSVGRMQVALAIVFLTLSAVAAALGIPRVLSAVREDLARKDAAIQSIAAAAAVGFDGGTPRESSEQIRAAMADHLIIAAVQVVLPDQTVAISVGPVGKLLERMGAGSPDVRRAAFIQAGKPRGEVRVLFKPAPHASVFHPSHPLFWWGVGLVVLVLPAVVAGVGMVRRRYDRSPHGPLAAAARRARDTLDTLAEGVLLLDARGRIVFANRAFLGTIRAPHDLIGDRIADLGWVCHEEQSGGLFPWDTALRDAQAVHGSRVGLLCGAERAMFIVNCTPLLTKRNATEAVLVTFDDVTALEQNQVALKEARDAAEHANEAKSQFLAMMSHEIRTPLNGVNGTLQLLARSSLDPRQAHYVGAARFSATSLLHLINDILDFSKIEAGQLELSPIAFDLEACVDETFLMLSPNAAAKGLCLAYEVEKGVAGSFHADPDRIRQIIINLVNNAIKFTPHGSVVLRISGNPCQGSRQLLTCAVTDTGIGIPADRLHRLFKAFSQVDSTTSRRYGGTGLGLVISKQLCAMMGGDITVSSTVGQGTTFTFTLDLPLATVEQAGVRAAPAAPNTLILVGLHEFEQRNCIRSLAVPQDRVRVFSSIARFVEDWHEDSRPDGGGLAVLGGATAGEVMTAAASLCNNPRFRAVRFAGAVYGQDTPLPHECPQIGRWIRRPLGRARLVALWNGDDQAPVPQDHSQATESLQGVRVLLAEDNDVGQMVVKDMLVGAGAVCDVVSDGHQVIAALRRARYDVVLMDCFMPELDGFETTRQLREMEKTGELAGSQLIIALTAKAMRGDRETCLQAGMNGYISKPVDEKELLRTIGRHLARDNAAAPKPPVPPASSTDMPLLLRRFGHKPEMLRRLIAAFRETSQEDLARIDEALRTGNRALLEQAAHRLAGGAGFVCAARVRHTAAGLEASCTEEQLNCLAEQAAELRGQVEEALGDLDGLARSAICDRSGTHSEEPTP